MKASFFFFLKRFLLLNERFFEWKVALFESFLDDNMCEDNRDEFGVSSSFFCSFLRIYQKNGIA